MRTVRTRRLGVRGPATVLLAVSALVALSACGNSDDPDATDLTPSTSVTSPTPTPTESPTESPSAEPTESATPTPTETEAPKPLKIKAIVKEGVATVVPDVRTAVVGQTVRILVKSDVADQLHVVGIEQTLPVEPGQRGTLEFVVPAEPGAGTYDVKFDTSGLVLFQLVVS